MGAGERLKSLKNQHNLPFICIQEPKRIAKHITKYMMKLGYQHSHNNLNNKIWLFWDTTLTVHIVDNAQQHITCHISCAHSGTNFYLTCVYAECTIALRRPLWEELQALFTRLKRPWGVIGDFNVITSPEEKQGGACYNMQKSVDFLECLTQCGLIDAGFQGAQYTWCNNWGHPRTIWKRLDRLLFNEEWLDLLNDTKVTHLSKTGSDHAPLLVNIEKMRIDTVKYFKFLNVWCNHKDFMGIVKEAWTTNTQGTAMWKLHKAYGDIFRDAKEAEKRVNELEKKLTENNNVENRANLNKTKAEFIRLLKNQDEINRQKAKARWLQDGDKNTSYFHKVIKYRRRKLNIQSIQDNEGHTIEGHQSTATTTIKHFEDLFGYQEIKGNFSILDIVPKLVTDEMNAMLTTIPTIQEIRQAIKSIDPDSSPGPDGFGAKFFQVCIDIILPEVYGAIKEFFEDAPVPRGFRQGDPLSPALFIICAELISRMLNNLVLDENFTGYYRPKKGSTITHLAFADDIILFPSGKPADIRKILKILTVYKNVSGQMINKHKSCVAFSPKANMNLKDRVTTLTGMTKKEWPIKYLGCPLFVGRMKINYFSEMVQSITRRMHSWHSKFLSMGGKIILIKHVLLAMHVHLLAAMKPPKATFEQIEAAIARFLWNSNENEKKYHWAKWESMCLPYEEGWVGCRCLRDMSKAFMAKQWWNLRTKESLWKDYIMAKYCCRSNPVIRKVTGVQSQNWRAMCMIRTQMEDNIIWQIGQGHVSFWYDNWTGEGALAGHSVPWAVKVAIQNMTVNFTLDTEDKDIWTPNLEGSFSISSAWNLLRKKVVGDWHDKRTWNKNITLKINFHFWRVVKNRLSTNDNIGRFKIHGPSICCCCPVHRIETVEHLFGQSKLAQDLWTTICQPLGIKVHGIPLRQIMVNCWTMQAKNPVTKLVRGMLPQMICWEIWKARCNTRFSLIKFNFSQSMNNITSHLMQIITTHFPLVSKFTDWYTLCTRLNSKSTMMKYQKVKWYPPPPNFIKLNSDGSCKGDDCGGGGIIRTDKGLLLAAYTVNLGKGTSNWVEAKALQFGYSKEKEIPWNISPIVNWTQRMVNQNQIQTQHWLREANQVADKLAQLSHHTNDSRVFNNFQELPKSVGGIINIDRWGLPSIRSRPQNNAHFFFHPP
ncbi:uncharacterized protein LOC132613554 [Lycium barbarum]|uniref:uncharacterized protein LOC132613554 n=1 Tax=Lycium barbarum TaxID=112863 RepID=UPI00293E932A|nr:uncharacterized protein LOC132613554 [Lycium barbarum]